MKEYKLSKEDKAIKVLHAFNSGDTLRKFTELITTNNLLPESKIQDIYLRLDKAFCTGRFEFLEDTTTERQAGLLIVNGEIWSHRNMYNTLVSLKEQRTLSKRFDWVLEEV